MYLIIINVVNVSCITNLYNFYLTHSVCCIHIVCSISLSSICILLEKKQFLPGQDLIEFENKIKLLVYLS